ncbi:hypothetical protein [Psychrobacter sp. ANT_H3]|uniref:hypothetical protein n=1 Tax=Psychrobacter sp. ANT_H3 TaxID=3019444 RepID=UPI0022F14CDB|nr:hypothetical protein [Psychrobacter sp. ANT_H3]MDA5132389.1 hypothetical protein [Psychrobacter sp. ANT_H3]
MSPSSNDINPDTATKLLSNSFNSDDVILNIEGRKRMRRPYERYMQQQAMQKSLEHTAADVTMVHKLHKQSENHQSSDIIHSNETVTSHQSTSLFCADTAIPTKKPRKISSLNHAKFLSVMAIFCAVFLLAVFAFNYLLSKNSQVPLGVNSASVAKQMNADLVTDPNSTPTFIAPRDETQNERQNGNEQINIMNAINAIKVKTTLSEHDFRQEAQNTLFRDSEKQASQKPDIVTQPEINPQDFKAEAKSILYRDETKAGK